MLTEISATESDLDSDSDTGLATALFCIIYLMFRFLGDCGEDTEWERDGEKQRMNIFLCGRRKRAGKRLTIARQAAS